MSILKNEIAKITEPKTLTEIVKVAPTLPTIGKLIREGNEDIKKVAMKAIIEIFEFYNEQLNPIQIPLILEQFLNQAKPLTTPEISIFRANCLNGSYPLKFRLTPNVFIDWLKEYQYDRMTAFENSNLKAKIEIEKQPISEKTTEMLKKLAETVKPKPSELVYSTDTSREEQQAKELQKHLTKEFDYLWDKQGKQTIEINELHKEKYVVYKPTEIDKKRFLDNYLRIRFKEIYDKIYEDYKKQTELNLSDYIFESINKLCQR